MTEVYFFFFTRQVEIESETVTPPVYYYYTLEEAKQARKTAINDPHYEYVSPLFKGYIDENYT